MSHAEAHSRSEQADHTGAPAGRAGTAALMVAVDAGGSTTRAVLIDRAGRGLATATAGPGNPLTAAEAAWTNTAGVIAEVVAQRTAGMVAPGAVLVTMAGHLAGASSPTLAGLLAERGLPMAVDFASDVLSAYCSGAAELDGYVLLAGTGAVAARVRGGELAQVSDGAGWLLGDVGSGFWIGHQVARAVAAALDGRGPATMLTQLVFDHLGLARDLDPGNRVAGGWRAYVDAVYAAPPTRVAQWAPLALRAVDDDAVAAAIVADAARGLVAALDPLGPLDRGAPLVLSGGLLGSDNPLSRQVASGLGAWTQVRRVSDGLRGAARLAWRRAGVEVDPAW